MRPEQTLSFAAQQVRRFDRERFVTALFAPAALREDLLVLYAFNLEVARIRENVHQAMAGMIRLQWWREVLDGQRDAEAERNPVAGPLLALVRRYGLPLDLFEGLLTAREADLTAEPPADLDTLEIYADATAGNLAELAAHLLAADAPSRTAARSAARAFALTGLLRSVPVALSTGWLTLPIAELEQARTSPQQVLAGKGSAAALSQVAQRIGECAAGHLAAARRSPVMRQALAAALPAILAETQLKALRRSHWNLFDARHLRPRPMPLRLAWHYLKGRL